jgi:caspase domain-containing protein
MTRRALLSALAAAVVVGAAVGEARAARFAVIVGNNEGHGRDMRLQYAETDAERMARLLVNVGGFEQADTTLLRGKTAADIRQALTVLRNRLGGRSGQDLVVFYYSGHADADSLHVGRESLPLAELKAQIAALPATARVVVLDACQAGSLLGIKGGAAAPVFDVMALEALPRGLALLASSTESEVAQESEALGGSFFTHFLLTGLRGAADRDRNGSVSLAESYEFASRHTLAATVTSPAGPQHPTFRFDLAGQQDIALTFPGRSNGGWGRLVFDRPGRYYVRQRDGGALVTELVSNGGEELALDPGGYEVLRRAESHVEVSSVDLSASQAVTLSRARTRNVAYGQVIRKGLASRPRSYGLAVIGGVRSDVVSLGSAATGAVVGRVDGRLLSLEIRAGGGRSERAGEIFGTDTWEIFTAVAGLRAFDLGRTTLAVGAQVGWAGFSQRIGTDARRDLSHAACAGPLAVFEVPVARRLFLRMDFEAPIYLLRTRAINGSESEIAPTVRIAAGAGVFF